MRNLAASILSCAALMTFTSKAPPELHNRLPTNFNQMAEIINRPRIDQDEARKSTELPTTFDQMAEIINRPRIDNDGKQTEYLPA